MSTETAPDSCPFCGAALGCKVGRKPAIGEDGDWARFECGTYWYQEYENQREDQTSICIAAERERLTRELSESKATIKRLETEKAFLSESHLAQENKRLAGEMLELRNAIQRDTDAFLRLTRERDEARAERDNLLARVQRLEEALSANRVFHTPIALRRRGGEWDEYELDAIRRTREEIGAT